ncbi:hypothetical protein ACFXA3_05550 [Streptomyces sp. NPDC059456]|uniref:hypothetical protein n=1 Tax=Streptomyces sp. NPDC059456 TaxID=3346838 RepID=UPI00369E3C0E
MTKKGSEQRISSVSGPDGQQRALIVASFVSRVGNGLFNTASVLYSSWSFTCPPRRSGSVSRSPG